MSSQFVTTSKDATNMSSQFVTTSPQKRPKSAVPYAFTENGIAMLSGVLRSPMAIATNIHIMRFGFVKLEQPTDELLSKM